MRRGFCWLLAVVCLCTCFFPLQSYADSVDEVQRLIDGIVQYQCETNDAADVQDWIDGTLTEHAGTSAEWYVLALCQGETAYDFSGYTAALEAYLEADDRLSAVSSQKYALLLQAVGSDAPFIAETADAAIGQQGIMSWIFGLHLLNNGLTASCTTEEAVQTLLALQLEDGGWALSGDISDADVTAMALQALAPHRERCADAIDRALDRLSQLQRETGDFASYGVPNPESTAQVLLALAALGEDGLTDERFVKHGRTLLDGIGQYQLPDGSFSHTLDGASHAMATEQVFVALTAWQRQQAGKPSFYLLDAPDPAAKKIPVRLWICLGILAAGGVVCLVLWLLKKRHVKNFLAVLGISGVAMVLVLTTDIQRPEDYYRANAPADAVGTVTISIRCDTVAGRADHLPEDGVLLDAAAIPFAEGDSVFDVLTYAAAEHQLQMEYDGTPEMAYIRGIGNLYEFDHGDLSGWVYHVNGTSPSVGCGEYIVADGDVIVWHYTLDLGKDVAP